MRNCFLFPIHIPLLAAWLVLGGFALAQEAQPKLPVVKLSFKGVTINAEVAKTDEEQTSGLAYRKPLVKNNGMLFVYPEDVVMEVYTKDVPFPVSIAFLDDWGRVMETDELEARSEEIYRPITAAKYVLVMKAGWFPSHRVGNNDTIMGVLKAAPSK